MEEGCIDKNIVADLLRVKGEFDRVVESIELMGDKEFMDSFKKAKLQIKKREFTNWDEL